MSKQTDLINIPDAITVSGSNVGIGTSNPSQILHVGSTTSYPTGIGLSNSERYYAIRSHNYSLVFTDATVGQERMRIDSSGNLLVGKTSTAFGTAGIEARSGGTLWATASGTNAASFNRLSSDGVIAYFNKDGTAVGSIGTSGGDLIISGRTSSAKSGIRFDNNTITPALNGADVDASVDLGYSSRRFKDAYLSGGVYLGGTGSANKLDDFEEGLYTVSAQTGSGSITLDSTNNKYSYVKVGKLVTVTGRIDVSSVSSPSGSLALTLPFTVSTGVKYESAVSLFIWSATSSAPETGLWIGWVTNGSNTISLRYGNSNTPSANVANYIQAGTEFRIGVSYETDA